MKNKSYLTVWWMCGVYAGLLWLILIAGEATGAVDIGWPAVLLGCIWIPAIMLTVVGCEVLVLLLAVRIKRKLRERKVMERTRAQAIALGIWKKPNALGGRALTMSAWENFGIKRERGETDMELRRRCIIKAAEERGDQEARADE